MLGKDQVTERVKKFLQCHHTRSRPLLVAVSGGPDSSALFFALLSLRAEHEAHLHVVHVDHNWREESGEEAAALSRRLQGYEGVTVHTVRLSNLERGGNREDYAREARLAIFKELARRHDCQAVLLGHHAGDAAETVFKRIVDGASLPKLGGLRPVHRWGDLALWRPFLELNKQQLEAWLKQRGIPYYCDRTNGADHCLRGKLRERVFPMLEKELSKSFSQNLVRLGEAASELEQYLDLETDAVFGGCIHGPLGWWLDLAEAKDWHLLLLSHVVRRFCGLIDLVLSRESVLTACTLIRSGAADAEVGRGGQTLHIDRGRLFLFSHYPKQPHYSQRLEANMRYQFGDWQIETALNPISYANFGGWQDLWKGGCQQILFSGDCWVGPPVLSSCYPRDRSLSRWYTRHRIPAVLRLLVPVLWSDGRIACEFLAGGSGSSKNIERPDMIFVRVSPIGAGPFHEQQYS